MNPPIRWAILGTGALAHQVACDFRLARGAALHAVASRTPERTRMFAERHGIPKRYVGLDALLNDSEVDAVYVATPNDRHADDSLRCIQAEKAVLCEKPFTLNAQQAQRIADEARRRRVFCMEAMWTRFIPAVMEAKRRIDGGELGRVRLIQGNFAYPVLREPGSRFFDPIGGGALLDRGVYLISLAQHFLGRPESIRGTACLGPTGVDEQSSYQLRYADDALADFAASFLVRGTNEVLIFGDRGSLRICDPFYRADRLIFEAGTVPSKPTSATGKVAEKGAGSMIRTLGESPAARSVARRLRPIRAYLNRRVHNAPFAGNGYQFEIAHVNECLRDQRTESPIMPLGGSVEVMQIMDALRSEWHAAREEEGSNVSVEHA